MINGINDKTYELLFDDLIASNNNADILYHNDILNVIDSYTIVDENKLAYLAPYLLNKRHFNFINKDNSNYIYNDGKSVIKFDKISNYLNDKKDLKELLSSKRYSNCHCTAINLALKMKKGNVITGNSYGKDSTYLHSVVEMPDGNIWDWTKNLIMKKEDYYFLTNFNVINIIENVNIINDEKIFDKLDLELKSYTLFRNQIINDLSKNKNLFKNLRR